MMRLEKLQLMIWVERFDGWYKWINLA